MADKSVGAYRQVFQHVKAAVRQRTGHRLRPQRIVVDNEVSLMSVIDTDFPQATFFGCYFHFCQSLWRRIQSLGMARVYRQDRQLKRCLRMIMAIEYHWCG
uniref:MULE transposase domain-containing protein n=1 Tax=Branchiostoma floridae TaxID=7739 RepID=C3Y831_BRAFL|eukprot:XP_002607490.1 hypothetical protein BRAFLDRAFT_69922 [Branchiostoma floridae]